ncbi:MAG: Gfo/Idh/MocA family oxidoreductase [Victivallaceae bacterium]|nr:Gfo/Idh/MocA family oxidoreductase [Victivallaceae bacterium]
MKIGLVDIDTSHPANWIPIIRELGHEVTAVWDGGTVFRKGYAREFASQYNIGCVAADLEEMADMVDCAIIHSCNWDLHVLRARVFMEKNKSVLLDKPMAGNMRDIRQIIAWSKEGHRICGGSSLRFTKEIGDFLAKPEEERGAARIALVGCGVDDFNYGIHAYSLLWSILGAGAKSVRYLGTNLQKQAEVVWENGSRGILTIGKTNGIPFYATIIADKGMFHFTIDSSNIYRALLKKTLPYLAGEIDNPPITMQELIEPEIGAIALMESMRQDGKIIELSDISVDSFAYNGCAFAKEYRKERGN